MQSNESSELSNTILLQGLQTFGFGDNPYNINQTDQRIVLNSICEEYSQKYTQIVKKYEEDTLSYIRMVNFQLYQMSFDSVLDLMTELNKLTNFNPLQNYYHEIESVRSILRNRSIKKDFDYRIEKLYRKINMVHMHLIIAMEAVSARAQHFTSVNRFRKHSQSGGKKKKIRLRNKTLKRKNKKKRGKKSKSQKRR